VQIQRVTPSVDEPHEVEVRCRFLVYQNRIEYETYTFVGKRTDLLRKTEDSWKIARCEILLDQNVLQAKNLSTFF
jgi:3-phenylpropionate/cinnamic acid dioxygenase small subunit